MHAVIDNENINDAKTFDNMNENINDHEVGNINNNNNNNNEDHNRNSFVMINSINNNI
jgi:hypothetical protein